MHVLLKYLSLLIALVAGFAAAGPQAMADLRVTPSRIRLGTPEASQQLLVSADAGNGAAKDLTRSVRYEIVPPGIAIVNRRGLIRPLADGQGELTVLHNDQRVTVPVEVNAFKQPAPVSFRDEIIPIFTKSRCNSGGCHGKAEGQNGFRLSIFGFNPAADYESLVMESRGRRVSAALPERSLLSLKGTARVPHGGGQKIEPGGHRDQLLLRWIKEGARLETSDGHNTKTAKIEINPSEPILFAGQSQQLQITAVDAAGNRRCVTTEAEYISNATTIADVDSLGLIQASDIPGEAAILVRYLEHVAVCRIVLPRPGVEFKRPAENNFIDQLVWNKLEQLGIQPSPPADDATFLRRVTLDTIGTLPTPEEARTFLADKAPDKRA